MDRNYRILILDTDQAVTGALCAEFANDERALSHAKSLLSISAFVELWQTDRQVAKWTGGACASSCGLPG
jgi:hypothetical protein